MRAVLPFSNGKGSADLSMPFFILAILGAIVLPNFWGDLPFWGRCIAIGIIGVLIIAGIVSLSQPSGLGARALEQEIKQKAEEDD